MSKTREFLTIGVSSLIIALVLSTLNYYLTFKPELESARNSEKSIKLTVSDVSKTYQNQISDILSQNRDLHTSLKEMESELESTRMQSSEILYGIENKIDEATAKGYYLSLLDENSDMSKSVRMVDYFDDIKGWREHIVDGKKRYTLIDVYYATDRKANKPSIMKDRFIGKRDKAKLTQYGITQVSIPDVHEIGNIETRKLWKFEFSEDPEKHITIADIQELNSTDYFQKIKNSIKDSEGKNAFIFIHGFNVSFEDAAKRTGQIAYDLEFKGVPVFYSWPSQGKFSRYTEDEANIKWSQPHIESFIEDFALNSGVENIYLLAHSMGSRGLTRAYVNLLKKNPALKSKFKEIILAAPDIDADVFKDQIAPKMADIGAPVTLYSSSEDIALKASHAIHGHTRAGDSGEGQLILTGFESIDSTNVKSDFIGHSSYADNIAILSDMYYLINRGLRAVERRGLDKHQKPAGVYWKFKKLPD